MEWVKEGGLWFISTKGCKGKEGDGVRVVTEEVTGTHRRTQKGFLDTHIVLTL